MTRATNHGRHAAPGASSRRADARTRRYGASKAAAVALSVILVVIAAASWRLSSAEHNSGTTENAAPYALGTAIVSTLGRADLLASLEDDMREIVEAEIAAGEQASLPDDDGPLPLASIEPANLDSIPSGTQLAAFSIFGEAPELSGESLSAIESAIGATEQMGTVGLVFFDASTGKGIAYNSDAPVYGASSFKGPYAVYVCQSLVDGGLTSLDSPVDVTSDNPGSIAIDPASRWAMEGLSTYPVDELITAAVTESDNDAYGMLRNQFDSLNFDEWIAGLDVDDAPRDPLSWYPTYCARSSAKLWTNALAYFESESETASWLSELFEQTQTSFIRDGIAGTEDGRSATIRDKAGWIADSDPAYNAVCDAGIIEADGHTYVMCIMTGQPDCTEARDNVGRIAAALFEARESLE